MNKCIYNLLRWIWRHLPLSGERKRKIKIIEYFNKFTYLDATRIAKKPYGLNNRSMDIDFKKPIAIIIHAFYEDVFEIILDYIANLKSVSFDLYVSCTPENETNIRAQLTAREYPFTLLVLSNRGRDVLPFIKMMPQVLKNDYDLLIKVHTKKSLHCQDGHEWLIDLLNGLLTDVGIVKAKAYLKQNPDTGVLGPARYALSVEEYLYNNEEQLKSLSCRMGMDNPKLSDLKFIAGTMFLARPVALLALENLALDTEDFEEELGQIDGTMAHAVERVISVSAKSVGLVVGGI